MRPFEDGKRRLATVLSDDERTTLNRDFFDHVLAVAGAKVGAGRCVVASASAAVRARAAGQGAHAVADPAPDDLNAALTAAARFALAHGAGSILSISCDLPLLTAADLGTLVETGGNSAVVIAADLAGTGTNAMIVTPPLAIPYRYGAASLSAHSDAAASAALSCAIVRSEGLARDIDVPSDLHAWRTQPPR